MHKYVCIYGVYVDYTYGMYWNGLQDSGLASLTMTVYQWNVQE